KKTYKHYLSIISSFLLCAGVVLCITALARPQSMRGLQTATASGVDIMLVIDTSGSMMAIDPHSNLTRMDYANRAAKDFVRRRPNDRIGIVVFSGVAITQVPLTLDTNALVSFIDLIDIRITRSHGTAIGSAIATAAARLAQTESDSRVMILLTDGVNNTGEIDPISAAYLARDVGIKIYAIGVGSPNDLIEVTDPFFGRRRIRADDSFDSTQLIQIADITGGVYFHASNARELERALAEIDELERSEFEYTQNFNFNEEYLKFLLWAFWLLFAGAAINVFLKRF
ncbi:MAG: VWA domain-containing protein, partial [Elusimicrobia bacterium]|nr:VWA domain-containing protein [Elusimicrobiota bacterium]